MRRIIITHAMKVLAVAATTCLAAFVFAGTRAGSGISTAPAANAAAMSIYASPHAEIALRTRVLPDRRNGCG